MAVTDEADGSIEALSIIKEKVSSMIFLYISMPRKSGPAFSFKLVFSVYRKIAHAEISTFLQ
jgi:hypothetical protein